MLTNEWVETELQHESERLALMELQQECYDSARIEIELEQEWEACVRTEDFARIELEQAWIEIELEQARIEIELEQECEMKREARGKIYEAHVSTSPFGCQEPVSAFRCPITRDTMTDPVSAADGYTYERCQIEEWLEGSNMSPITELILPNNILTSNIALRCAIEEWRSLLPSWS